MRLRLWEPERDWCPDDPPLADVELPLVEMTGPMGRLVCHVPGAGVVVIERPAVYEITE